MIFVLRTHYSFSKCDTGARLWLKNKTYFIARLKKSCFDLTFWLKKHSCSDLIHL